MLSKLGDTFLIRRQFVRAYSGPQRGCANPSTGRPLLHAHSTYMYEYGDDVRRTTANMDPLLYSPRRRRAGWCLRLAVRESGKSTACFAAPKQRRPASAPGETGE
jgi:hypothetical protein